MTDFYFSTSGVYGTQGDSVHVQAMLADENDKQISERFDLFDGGFGACYSAHHAPWSGTIGHFDNYVGLVRFVHLGFTIYAPGSIKGGC
jgi:hypothetical protein